MRQREGKAKPARPAACHRKSSSPTSKVQGGPWGRTKVIGYRSRILYGL